MNNTSTTYATVRKGREHQLCQVAPANCVTHAKLVYGKVLQRGRQVTYKYVYSSSEALWRAVVRREVIRVRHGLELESKFEDSDGDHESGMPWWAENRMKVLVQYRRKKLWKSTFSFEKWPNYYAGNHCLSNIVPRLYVGTSLGRVDWPMAFFYKCIMAFFRYGSSFE